MDNSNSMLATRIIVLVTTVFGVFTIYVKFWLEAVWRNFNNSTVFYKEMVQRQVKLGLVDGDTLTDNFKVKDDSLYWFMHQKQFWIELLIMIVIPLPMSSDSIFNNKIIIMDSPNYIDPANVNSQIVGGEVGPPGSGIAHTPYYASDFILAFMFFRIYFFFRAMLVLAPVNEKMHGKRVCKKNHVEASFAFQLKAS